MTALLLAAWPLALLIYLPVVAVMISSGLYWWLRSRLDHQIPDDLPHTAGQWLQHQLDDDLVLDVRAVVTDGIGDRPASDGYHTTFGIIQLTPQTHFKRDPVFWAIAAHELGHARLWSRQRLLTGLFTVARWARWGLARLGVGLAVGNLLYAMPEAAALGYRCLAIALALHVFELLDEAIASTLAMRALDRSAALTATHRRAVRLVLLAAFATYASSFLAHAALLSQWHRVVELTGDGRFGGLGDPLGGAAQLAAALASLLGVGFAAWQVFLVIAPRRAAASVRRHWLAAALVALLWGASLVVLLLLLWDLRADATYRWCVLLAMVPVSGVALLVLRLPLALLVVGLHALARRIRARHGIERSPVFVEALREGAALIEAGNTLLLELQTRHAADPPWRTRLGGLTRLLYLPLVAAYWL